MNDGYSIKRLLALRRVTRAASEILCGQARDYLQTLNHAFRPRATLGDYVSSPTKEPARNAEAAFAEFKSLYETVISAKPFGFRKDLSTPLVNLSHVPEITPWEYSHAAQSDRGEKRIAVTSPMRWVLHFAPYPPRRLVELVNNREQLGDELQQAAIHYLVMHVALSRQPGIVRLFAALRMPIESGRLPGFGDLPVPIITSEIRTVLPPDPVLVESTEISGRDAFEEVVDLQLFHSLADPLKAKVLELLQKEPELASA